MRRAIKSKWRILSQRILWTLQLTVWRTSMVVTIKTFSKPSPLLILDVPYSPALIKYPGLLDLWGTLLEAYRRWAPGFYNPFSYKFLWTLLFVFRSIHYYDCLFAFLLVSFHDCLSSLCFFYIRKNCWFMCVNFNYRIKDFPL